MGPGAMGPDPSADLDLAIELAYQKFGSPTLLRLMRARRRGGR